MGLKLVMFVVFGLFMMLREDHSEVETPQKNLSGLHL
jgi:hypothetical protein